MSATLQIDEQILVTHGFEYDPYIGNDLDGSHLATKVHHLVERYLNTWIRVPLGEFYTGANRFFYWLVHKYAVLVKGTAWIGSRFDSKHGRGRLICLITGAYQMYDPMCMFKPSWNV